MSQQITITIEGMNLPLTVKTTEEEKVYRDAARNVQKMLRRLRELYKDLSDNYYYAMALLNTAVDSVKAQNSAATEPFIEMMKDLTTEMDEAMKK